MIKAYLPVINTRTCFVYMIKKILPEIVRGKKRPAFKRVFFTIYYIKVTLIALGPLSPFSISN